ncbi:phosphoribosyl-AMP cyclohydrolase [Sandarakinorhabdus sp.]|jgi:phosphoribosyl-AMP cyclohydrolase|uniref:phosphoribosyl-AMP cyclohydrolase n=1 Tax=Sandarakinorhabdus sp. TaxID=1916663 RepID=UPI00333E2DAE
MNATLDESSAFTPRWGADGLITAVAVDTASGAVLMVAHMNADALAATIATGEAHYWSRSRRELWHKGATSGALQRVVEIRVDCDQDCLLLMVEPAGPACHTGRQSCFYRRLGSAGLEPVTAEKAS